MDQWYTARSFDALRDRDPQVYEQSKQEVLCASAFRIALDQVHKVDRLAAPVLLNAAGLERWSAQESLEFSNRFRLPSAPGHEIASMKPRRMWDSVPRAREFDCLALNTVGRDVEAIAEG